MEQQKLKDFIMATLKFKEWLNVNELCKLYLSSTKVDPDTKRDLNRALNDLLKGHMIRKDESKSPPTYNLWNRVPSTTNERINSTPPPPPPPPFTSFTSSFNSSSSSHFSPPSSLNPPSYTSSTSSPQSPISFEREGSSSSSSSSSTTLNINFLYNGATPNSHQVTGEKESIKEMEDDPYVFFSWQESNERKQALVEALEKVCKDQKIKLLCSTRELPGSPLAKIKDCTIYIVDIVDESINEDEGRKRFDENVLIELGFALASVPPEKTIYLVGKDDNLPFNIKNMKANRVDISNLDDAEKNLTAYIKKCLTPKCSN